MFFYRILTYGVAVRLLLYYHTVRNLRFKQIWHRLPVLKKIGVHPSKEALDITKAGNVNMWIPSLPSETMYRNDHTFTFLNRSHRFYDDFDWDFKDNGLLWTYNLTYFEFLDQRDMEAEMAYGFIDDFLEQYPTIKTAHDPYTISLRLIFWIRFFIRKNNRPMEKYLKALHSQAKELQGKLEYHLLGNHLLENAFALFFAGSYLNDRTIIKRAKRLLKDQLNEQILDDGGHFELSPMYHQLILYRLLDCINMAKASLADESKDVISFLEEKASVMQGWMKQMSFSDGTFPLFNDAAYGIAPDPEALIAYAGRLGIPVNIEPLNNSGYRKWTGSNWEMIMDVGHPGPAYQPGHAHCDALSFVLQVGGKPVLVDTGTSVYGGDVERRKIERGTASHNTVQIDNLEQSEIWGDFRMGKQANVQMKKEHRNEIEVILSGFYPNEIFHTRKFEKTDHSLKITDTLSKKLKVDPKAFFHFHHSIDFKIINQTIKFHGGEIIIDGANRISKLPCYITTEFGKLVPSFKVEVLFSDTLNTRIEFEN